MSEETQKQHKKQNYDWLKGYQFVKGQSGNPGGRPKGSKSLKTFVKEYLERLPDEEKIEYLKKLSPDLVWQMAEGRPANDMTLKGDKDNPIAFENLSDEELDERIKELENRIGAVTRGKEEKDSK